MGVSREATEGRRWGVWDAGSAMMAPWAMMCVVQGSSVADEERTVLVCSTGCVCVLMQCRPRYEVGLVHHVTPEAPTPGLLRLSAMESSTAFVDVIDFMPQPPSFSGLLLGYIFNPHYKGAAFVRWGWVLLAHE